MPPIMTVRRIAAQRPVARVAVVAGARERASVLRRRRRALSASASATPPSSSSSSSSASSPPSSSTTTTSSRSPPPPPPPPILSPFEPFRGRSYSASSSSKDSSSGKIIWVEPWTADAAQAASEAGVRTLLFDERDAARAADFGTLARFDTVVRFGDGLLCDATGRAVGVGVELRSPADVRRAEGMASGPLPFFEGEEEEEEDDCGGAEDVDFDVDGDGEKSNNSNRRRRSVVLADARDWSIIPAENLVAAFQEARRRRAASHETAVREWEEESSDSGNSGSSSEGKQKRRPRPRPPRPTPLLLVTASTADGALALLGALEAGVDGVVLRTGDASQVRALASAVEEAIAATTAAAAAESVVSSSSSSSSPSSASKNSSSNVDGGSSNDNDIGFEVGVVTSVTPAGMGDRVCVDTTVLLEPGEGLLVGSFAAAALLVHSERDGQRSTSKSNNSTTTASDDGSDGEGGDDDGKGESDAYISPRPFRVNAGAVHSYVAVPRGRTAYLSELEAGSEVLVVRPPTGSSSPNSNSTNSATNSATTTTKTTTRTAVVGRAKVERRPMVRVDVALSDGTNCSAVLQNAETVRVVAPAAPPFASPASAAAAAASSSAAPPPRRMRPRSPPRRRRLGAEDEEALRWAMEPSSASASSSPPSPSSSSSSPSSSSPFPLRKLGADAEKTLEWVMGPPSAAAAAAAANDTDDASSPSSLCPPGASPSSCTASSSSSDSDAEELVEGPPPRPHLPPRKHDSRAAAALRWLLNGGKQQTSASAAAAAAAAAAAPAPPAPAPPRPHSFPSPRWDPSETRGWRTVPVTELARGQPLLVRRAAAARHTGIEIEEFVVER